MKTSSINQHVTISSIGFGHGGRAYPRRMEFGGCSYNFVDTGLCARVRRGERLAQIFTMTDGTREYCLRKEQGNWTLLSICG